MPDYQNDKNDRDSAIGPLEDMDEDLVFDAEYARREAALNPGSPNAFGLTAEELAFGVDDEDEEEIASGDEDADDEAIGTDNFADEDEQFALPSDEEECDRCAGTGFEPGGDGAQCNKRAGEGCVPVRD